MHGINELDTPTNSTYDANEKQTLVWSNKTIMNHLAEKVESVRAGVLSAG
jgi:hypothetical protein